MNLERAHKNETIILKVLTDKTQAKVAAELEVDESLISKAKNNLQLLSRILAACELKVVPTSVKCYDPQYIESIQHLAREHLRTTETSEIRTLQWD